jgi:glycosyltransferase involved in cell wall biosynthesis
MTDTTRLAPKPSLSVLVCTRNRPEKLRRAVASILANSFSDFELVVVDQSTDGKTAAELKEVADERVRYIPTSTVGVAISRNIAVRASRAAIVVFTDDDCICDTEWLLGIVREYASDPAALGVYGRVMPYGTQRANMICPCINESMERRVHDTPAIPHIAFGGGNNMSFKKELFEKVGMFVESLGPGTRLQHAEDTEFSYRILWYRCRIIYSPHPVVQHDKWLDRGQFAELMTGAVRGLALVFMSYALRFDMLAFTQLLRTGYYTLRNRMSIGSAPVGIAYFIAGVMLGTVYRVLRPPRLHPAASIRSST